MNLSLILFLIGILGFVLNRKNIILRLISIEIMLLAIIFLILISSLSFDDILDQTYAIYVIGIVGAESAIGLGILMAFYRLNSSLNLSSFSLGRHLRKEYPVIVGGKGNLLFTSDERKVFDACSGAAVSCLGYGNQRVTNAVLEQMNTGTPYVASTFWASSVVEELCEELIRGTDGEMARVYLTGSGSEAMEAAIKLSRQIFYEKDKETGRVNFIARDGSYHGNTIGALGISGHLARRAPYTAFLMKNVHHISSCNPYRQRKEGESDAAFVARKAAELETKFQELGPETVIGFIAEPVVGL